MMLDIADNNIKHKKTKVARPQTNGFVERFHRTILDEFFRQAFRTKLYLSIVDLQADMDVWLHHYNRERPHQGYRNLGKRPIDTLNAFLALPDYKQRCLRCLTSSDNDNVRQKD